MGKIAIDGIGGYAMRRLAPVELSYRLCKRPDRAAYRVAACTRLYEAIGCDRVGRPGIDLMARSAEIWRDPLTGHREHRAFIQVAPECPAVRHYRRHPRSFEPSRTSDVMADRKWRSNQAHREYCRPPGIRYPVSVRNRLRDHRIHHLHPASQLSRCRMSVALEASRARADCRIGDWRRTVRGLPAVLLWTVAARPAEAWGMLRPEVGGASG
jgi:hypothetical protein